MNTASLLVLRGLLFFDMNTQESFMKSIIGVPFTSPLIVDVSFLAAI